MKQLVKDGDTRWIERGAYDLMDLAPDAVKSSSGMPRARVLYGSLPQQLDDPQSFASKLSKILHVRKRFALATAALVDVPEVPHKALLALVNRLSDGHTQITLLNFSEEKLSGYIRSDEIPAGRVVDLSTRRRIAEVDDLGGFSATVQPFGAMALIVREQPPEA